MTPARIIFIHKRRIENMNITEEVVIKLNGKVALEYLNQSFETTGYPAPELIFLDINMPVNERLGVSRAL